MDEIELEQILEQAGKLDAYALGGVHDHYYPLVYRYVCYRLGDEQSSREVCSNILLLWQPDLVKRRAEKQRLQARLFQMAASLTDRELRRRASQRDAGQRQRMISADESKTIENDSAWREMVRWSFNHLAFKHQHILALRFSSGYSFDQVSKMLGKTANELKLEQYNALAHFRTLLSGKEISQAKKAEPKVRALEVCLERMESSESKEIALEPYPYWTETLRPLLETALAARSINETIHIPQDAQAQSREAFLRSPERVIARPRHAPNACLASLAGVLLILSLIIAAIWLILAVPRAIPGQIAYPLKLAGEDIRLWLATSPRERLDLEQSFDEERLKEITLLVKRSASSEIDFSGGLSQAADGEWIVAKIRLHVPPEAQVAGQVQMGSYVNVKGTLQPDGSVTARRIQPREFEVVGRLKSSITNQWTVDDVSLFITLDTAVHGKPTEGDKVRAVAYRNLQDRLVARLVEVLP